MIGVGVGVEVGQQTERQKDGTHIYALINEAKIQEQKKNKERKTHSVKEYESNEWQWIADRGKGQSKGGGG